MKMSKVKLPLILIGASTALVLLGAATAKGKKVLQAIKPIYASELQSGSEQDVLDLLGENILLIGEEAMLVDFEGNPVLFANIAFSKILEGYEVFEDRDGIACIRVIGPNNCPQAIMPKKLDNPMEMFLWMIFSEKIDLLSANDCLQGI